MASVKRKYSDIIFFLNQAQKFITDKKDHIFSEKLIKQSRKLRDIAENYNEQVRDSAIENCEVDEKSRIVYKDEAFVYTKEGLKAHNAKIKEINNKLVAFDLIITKDMTKKLDFEDQQTFNQFIEDLKE
jgi:hypothetical protein